MNSPIWFAIINRFFSKIADVHKTHYVSFIFHQTTVAFNSIWSVNFECSEGKTCKFAISSSKRTRKRQNWNRRLYLDIASNMYYNRSPRVIALPLQRYWPRIQQHWPRNREQDNGTYPQKLTVKLTTCKHARCQQTIRSHYLTISDGFYALQLEKKTPVTSLPFK